MHAGLVVPDVPLEETKTLREEAKKNGIELVCLLLKLFCFVSEFHVDNPYTVDYNDRETMMHLILFVCIMNF
jgi:hypothetical protein